MFRKIVKPSKLDLGKAGERLALQFLRRKGYRIIARNFASGSGEIDIIAKEADVTVFIEVKTRSSISFGQPEDAIGAVKIKHLRRCAEFFIKYRGHPQAAYRFDVVSILLTRPAVPFWLKIYCRFCLFSGVKIKLIKNAF